MSHMREISCIGLSYDGDETRACDRRVVSAICARVCARTHATPTCACTHSFGLRLYSLATHTHTGQPVGDTVASAQLNIDFL